MKVDNHYDAGDKIELTYETADGKTRNVAGTVGAVSPKYTAVRSGLEEVYVHNDGTLARDQMARKELGTVVNVSEWEEEREESNWYMGQQR